MARIETYPFDLAPTVNDYVIGTDGDNLNVTRNYKVMTFLDYLGTQYNLNSTDMLFEYDDVISTAVGDGYVSTNNYADATILMSGVTNIYVSKLTGFGQLVEDALNSIGDNGLTILFADMGNRNNYGIFEVVSAADVDANTINLTVTATTTLGTLTAGRSMGIRIGIGGGGGNFVTLDTAQTITALKSFYTGNVADPVAAFLGHVRFGGTIPTYNDSSAGFGYDTTSDTWFFQEQNGVLNFGLLNFKSITANRTYTFQDADGTVAFLSDLTGGYVDLTSVQTVGGTKSWDDLIIAKNSIWVNGGNNKITFANSSENNTQSTSGLTIYSKSGSLGWALPDLAPSNRRGIFTNANTAERTYTFQDADGTIAFLSDISTDYVGLTGNETVAGVKTFSNELRVNSGILVNGTTANNNVLRFGTANALDAPVTTASYNFLWLDTAGDIWVQRDGTTQGAMNLVNGGGTATRTHTFPDQSGTVAHTSDIPDYVASTSFSPTLTDAGGGATYTYTTTGSNYSRIGDIVRIHIVIAVTNSTGAASGNLIVGNLPYIQANFRELLHVEFSGANQSGTNFYSIHASQATVSTANLWFKMQTSLDQTNDTILSSWDYSSGGCNIIISGTYQTNDAV